MPSHLAIGTDVQHYEVAFNNVKTANLVFDIPYDRKPAIQISLGDTGNVPVFKTDVTPTGCKIRFKTKWTGLAEVTVITRGKNV